VRKLVLELEPRELHDLGLAAAVRIYCQQKAAAVGCNIHVNAPKPDVRAPGPVERACFRLLQDCLGNVLHNANAIGLWVHLHQDAIKLELVIRGSGIEFDRDVAREGGSRDGGSIDVFGMQIRARQAGGTVEIASAPGGGAEIKAVFPLSVTVAETV
jgi:signal transduction histidine kinase